MLKPEASPDSADIFDSELQLQQELESLFAVDTQKDLQAYYDLLQQIKPETWVGNIQELYRLIHTIKGGAVTVNAEAILAVAMVLENLLSDLRYLKTAPPELEQWLKETLDEGGELLASVISQPEANQDGVELKVQRLIELREQVRKKYLPEWNEQAKLQQEFAEEAFDLVVLDLEIAVANLAETEPVPEETVIIAQETLEQLAEIGQDLDLADGWIKLLQEAGSLLSNRDVKLWRSRWLEYFSIFKTSIKQGGKSVSLKLNQQIHKEEKLTPEPQQKKAIQQKKEKVQIPVPLERIELSTQYLIDTLLATRATHGVYEHLHQQLLQMMTLAQENVQYVANLRELQDDYALLGDRSRQDPDGLSPERYRKGYATINRLLENSLRLSELGAETETSAQDTAQRLQQLDGHILKLRNTLEESRLIPFQNLCFRAKAILRDLSNRYGKPVRLITKGESMELDVATVRALEPALLHLIRNAYDHGLEFPPERVKKHKSEKGVITLSLQRIGNNFMITLKDDGRGINPKAVQKRAKNLGLPLTNIQTRKDLLEVLCQPGFSAKTEVSEVSGRGVGLDVVAAQVTRIEGQLSLKTKLGVGTIFAIKFSVPHLLVPCLKLQSGELSFAIPTENVERISSLENLQVLPVKDDDFTYDWTIKEGSTSTPGLDLLTYWQPASRLYPLDSTAVAVYVRAQRNKPGIWLLADRLLGQSDLQIKPLPSPLIPPHGLMGVSLQDQGGLMPILEVAALVESLLNLEITTLMESLLKTPNKSRNSKSLSTEISLENSQAIESKQDISQPRIPKILVVDDAALVRRRIEASLSAYGYLTETCADGMEAWNWLQNNPHPNLIITDIEMPNMDGFSLIEKCRQAGITMPIIVISSRLAEEWGKEAYRIGATDFLTKGFSTVQLLSKVDEHL